MVVFNDRVELRIRALAERAEVVRLRQPIDLDWFTPSSALNEKPRRLPDSSATTCAGQRRELVEGVCRELGLDWRVTGTHGAPAGDPRPEILASDIVMGYGCSILEAMACRRAAYVLDHKGGDCWELRNSGALRRARGRWLRRPCRAPAAHARAAAPRPRRYRPEMGIANRDLAVGFHASSRHAIDVVALLRRLAPAAAPGTAPSCSSWHG